MIQLDTLDPRNRFQQDDLDVLVSVACQAAFAVENAQLHEAAMRDQAMRRELAVAHEVQRGLPALRRARGSPSTISSSSTSRPTSWAATITTTSSCPAAGWPWWWPTFRARAFPPRC